ncbi:MAG: leucine-rich repeat protein [Candidatus Izemoplasmatales bacterium]
MLNIQLQYVYSLAVEAGSFTGTYEEWLETVTGPQGEPGIDGREVLFKVEGSVLKWQYVGDGLVWTNLIDLTSIISLPDKIVTDVWINASGNLIVTYDDASEANLGDFLRDFTVIFKDLTGSIIKVENVGYGEDATAPTPPVVVGHTFVSWEGDYIGVTEDIEVEAIYSVNQQMVSFVTNSDVALEPMVVDYGDVLSLPVPAKAGYAFVGWFIGNTPNDAQITNTTPITGDWTLYARWSLGNYSVVFRDYFGSIVKTEVVAAYTSAIAPVHEDLPGYTFIGWDQDFSRVVSDMIISPLYKSIEYDLKYSLSMDYADNNPSVMRQDETIKDLYVGYSNAAIVTSQNRLLVWGLSREGQLTLDQELLDYPVDITEKLGLSTGESINKVLLGSFNTCILTSFGRMLMVGNNHEGQLADKTFTNSRDLIDVTANFGLEISEVILDVAGNHSHIAVTSNNRVFTWGRNDYGQLGNGTDINSNLPQDITDTFAFGIGETVVSIAEGKDSFFLVTSSGRVFAWGYNGWYNLGLGDTIPRLIPTDITPRFTFNTGEQLVELIVKYESAYVITTENRVLFWGRDFGIDTAIADTTSCILVPTDVTADFQLTSGETLAKLVIGYRHAMAMTSKGRILTVGYNGCGQLGYPTIDFRSTYLDISHNFLLDETETIIDINAHGLISFALTSQGRLFIFGLNFYHVASPNDVDYVFLSSERPMKLGGMIAGGSHSYAPGATLKLPSVPEIPGFSFSGWYLDELLTVPFTATTMPSGMLEVYGKMIPTEYTITYNLDGGTNNVANPDFWTTNDGTIVLEAPVKSGFEFAGWYLTPDLAGQPIVEITSDMVDDIILYAKWTEKLTYTIAELWAIDRSTYGKEVIVEGIVYEIGPDDPYCYAYIFDGTGYMWVSFSDDGYSIGDVVRIHGMFSFSFLCSSTDGELLYMAQIYDIIETTYLTDSEYTFPMILDLADVDARMAARDETLLGQPVRISGMMDIDSWNLYFSFSGGRILLTFFEPSGMWDYYWTLGVDQQPIDAVFTLDLINIINDAGSGYPQADVWHANYFEGYESSYTYVFYDLGDGVYKKYDIGDPGDPITEYIPSKEGYTFAGWYSDYERTQFYSDSITAIPNTDMLVYAKWTNNLDLLYEFTLLTDGTYEISDFYGGGMIDLVLPEYYEGVPITSIGPSAFYFAYINSVTIPDSVRAIKTSAFANAKIKNIYFGETSQLTSIGDNAFNINDIVTLRLPSGLTSIGIQAFANSHCLTSVILPGGLQTIGANAFAQDYKMTSIYIPNTVTLIGSGAMGLSIGTIYIQNGAPISAWAPGWNNYNRPVFNAEYGGNVDYLNYVTSGPNATIIGYALANAESVDIPANIDIYTVSEIGFGAFRQFVALRFINLPQGLTKIREYAFYCCSNMSIGTLPQGLLEVGINAFYGNSKLTAMIIPNTVTSINNNAFSDCINLTALYIPTSVQVLGSGIVTGSSNVVIYTSHSSQPATWNSLWNASTNPVHWATGGAFLVGGVMTVTTNFTEYIVVGSASYYNDTVSLPSEVIGLPLTTIATKAFLNAINLETIYIPIEVITIGADAFIGATNVTVHAAATSQPIGWDATWLPAGAEVIWGASPL